MRESKNRYFYHILLALRTPLRQSRKTLHEWKDNSVLAKPLAACTRLYSTVSQLFEPQVQKVAVYKGVSRGNKNVAYATFLFPLETPLRLSRNVFHGWKDIIQCFPNPSQHVPIYL